MLIKFYPPFDVGNRFLEMPSPEPISVQQMLQRLSAEYTGFAAFLPAEMSDEAVRNRMLIFVNGQVARLRDALSDRDVVEVVGPISGG